MFGKKKVIPQIDKDQLELIETAQKRIKQKKRLYIHFVVFLIGVALLILANIVGVGSEIQPLGIEWFVYVLLVWLSLILYHTFNVFVTHKFMGDKWEKNQLEKLVAKQKKRIEELKSDFQEDTPVVKTNISLESEKQVKVSGLTIIVAAAENDAIGKDNKLIWHLSDDLKRFKSLTNGHHIIMGRKTFESFPKPLPNRTHVVITKQTDYKAPEGVIVVNSLEEALDASKEDNQPFIIGGGQIYKQALGLVDKIELTRVHEIFEADAYFPKVDTTIWKETANVFHKEDGDHDYEFSFVTYERK